MKRTAAGGIGVDSTGAEVESFVNRLQGVMDDLSNAKGKGREDDWLDLMEDEELRACFSWIVCFSLGSVKLTCVIVLGM